MNWLKGGSGYTVNDLVYYSGLFLGIMFVFAVGRPYGFHPLLMLLGGVCVGAGLGFVMERFFKNIQRGSGSGSGDERNDSGDGF